MIRRAGLLIAVLAALCCFALPARAQSGFIQVSGTIVDPQGFPYAGGATGTATISAVLVPPGVNSPTLNGNRFSTSLATTAIDSEGHFLVQLADNTLVQPSGTQWQFTVFGVSGLPFPMGRGAQSFTVTLQIHGNGSTQDISTQLQAAAPSLTNVCPNSNITPPSPITCGNSSGGGCSLTGASDTQFIYDAAGVCASNDHLEIDYATSQAIDGLGIFFNPVGMSQNADNPTVTPTPSGGSHTWSYQIVARYGNLEGGPGSAGQTTTGPATLNGSNFNTITWTAVAGAVSYDVYRASGTCCGGAGSGRIGNTTALTFNDTGQSAEDNFPAYGTDDNVATAAVGFNGFSSINRSTGWVYIGEPQSNMGILEDYANPSPLTEYCLRCGNFGATFISLDTQGTGSVSGTFTFSVSGAVANSPGTVSAEIRADNAITSGTAGLATIGIDVAAFNAGNGNGNDAEAIQTEWGIGPDLGGTISGTLNNAEAILILSPETNTTANPAITDAAGIEIQNIHVAKVTTSYAIHLLSQNAGGFQIKTEGLATSEFGGVLTSGGGTQNVSGCSLTGAVGGAWAGSFASGTTGTCTVTITPGTTAPNGFICDAHDLTTPADTIRQTTPLSATTCTISGTTASGDTITWSAFAF